MEVELQAEGNRIRAAYCHVRQAALALGTVQAKKRGEKRSKQAPWPPQKRKHSGTTSESRRLLHRALPSEGSGYRMACFGSKVIQSRRTNPHNLVDTSQMAGEDNLSKSSGRKKGKNRRPRKEHHGADKDHSKENLSGRRHEKNGKDQKLSKLHNTSEQPKTVLRKRVDPETAKYFSEIANLFEGGGLEVDERSVICGNALEESRGKELELATDTILSHTLQTLLEGCDVDHLCSFLLSCAKDFLLIAMDKSGSHVVETALKSLALHLDDEEVFTTIEETITKICKVVAERPVDVMSDCYGSHVVRSLLCLCKGVALQSLEEFHVTKSAITLAERLNSGLPKSGVNQLPNSHLGFPHLLKFLVRGLLQHSEESLKDLCVNKYSSLVALKLLAGNDQELMHVIPLLLGYKEESNAEGKLMEISTVDGNNDLIQDNSYSHLMEVILEVAPETLHDEIFMKAFKGSLFEISSLHCGSFVVQALISSSRSEGQMDLIWQELGPRIKELLEIGKSGVVASLLAAWLLLLLFIRGLNLPVALFHGYYFLIAISTVRKGPAGNGQLPKRCIHWEFIQPYLLSITSMEVAYIFETAKDAGGGRVIESFLCSEASVKQKRKVIAQLRGSFGVLSMHPSGSFTVEKCFTAANLSLREVIASEILAIQPELSKTKQGPYLLKKLDIAGFAARPDQWKSRLASKQNAYKEFVDVFGSETKSQKKSILAVQHSHAPAAKNNVKHMRKEIEQCLQNSNSLQSSLLNTPGHEISLSKLGFPVSKRQRKETFSSGTGSPAKQESKKFTKNGKVKANERNKDEEIPLEMAMAKSGSHSKRHLQDDNSKSSVKKRKG
ncbi:hypothetical protein ACLOJK_000927 [Asimina triloba]